MSERTIKIAPFHRGDFIDNSTTNQTKGIVKKANSNYTDTVSLSQLKQAVKKSKEFRKKNKY